MGEQQGDGEQSKKRNVLRVEERMRVQPRLQHEQQRGQQRQRAAPAESLRQRAAGDAAEQKEDVRQHVTQQHDGAGVLQT